MTRQTTAANGCPWYETLTETDWQRLPWPDREARAWTRTGCTVAYPTWPAPVDCVHPSCHWYALRQQGRTTLADQLERNAKAQDWLANWGKLVYDPAQHGDSPERRQQAARIVRAMRKGLDYGTATIIGAWAGVAS